MGAPGLRRLSRGLRALRQVSPRDVALCVVAGVATFASFPTALAPEYTFFPLIWLSHVPLLWLLRDKGPREAFWWGAACGTLISGGGYYWIIYLLETFGHLPWPVAALGWVLHSVWQGLMWGAWAWLLNRIGNTTSVGIEWTAPVAFVGLEMVWPRIFPAYMGNSQYLFPAIMQITDLFGVTIVTFLIYRTNAVGFLWLRARLEGRNTPRRALAVTAAMLAASLVYGGYRMWETDNRVDAAREAGRSLKMGLVEGNVGIFQRESKAQIENHLLIQQNQSAALEKAGAELIVWPESSYRQAALPRGAKRLRRSDKPLADDYREDIRQGATLSDRRAVLRGFEKPLLFGALNGERNLEPRWKGDEYRVYNSAWLVDTDGAVVGSYDKVELLVGGEYIPLVEYIPWIFDILPAASHLERGAGGDVIAADLWGKGPIRFGMLICYEAILPAFTLDVGRKRPHVLMNLTNDDWFGLTAERYLHFALIIPRAIEHRVPLVRATLTGVSAFVDPNGRIVEETDLTTPETLLWDVPLLASRTVYQLVGDVFPWGCAGLTLLWFGMGWWRRR